MDHGRKALIEQIGVVWQHQSNSDELDLEFTRIHGLAIVQLCDQIMIEEGHRIGSESWGVSCHA
jgi:hypothetical protein